MIHNGVTSKAKLQNGKLYWSDGDMWKKVGVVYHEAHENQYLECSYEVAQMEAAAVKIQSLGRGSLCRRTSETKVEEVAAAMVPAISSSALSNLQEAALFE